MQVKHCWICKNLLSSQVEKLIDSYSLFQCIAILVSIRIYVVNTPQIRSQNQYGWHHYVIYVAFWGKRVQKEEFQKSLISPHIPFLLRILRIMVYNIAIASGFWKMRLRNLLRNWCVTLRNWVNRHPLTSSADDNIIFFATSQGGSGRTELSPHFVMGKAESDPMRRKKWHD